MKSKAQKLQALLSEQALAEIESISIRLESGKVATFDIAKELSVSNDPIRLHEQALTAHARYAFWEYQAGRAHRQLREKEIELARLEGTRRYSYSKLLKEDDRYVASTTIEGMLDSDNAVLAERNALTALREHWSILRTMASAHDHRSHLLRRLLARDQEATRG